MGQSVLHWQRSVAAAAAALALASVLSSVVKAAEIELFAPPDGFALAGPQQPSGRSGLDLYSRTEGNAKWYIAQWAIPGGRLSPFERSGPPDYRVYTAVAAAARVHVERRGSHFSYTLSENGRAIPCETAAGKPFEFDLLAETNESRNTPGSTPASLSGSRSVPLSSMHSLNQSATVRVVALKSVSGQRDCAVNQGGAFFAVVLSDAAIRPKQTLFYKLTFATFCGPGPRETLCWRRSGVPVFYFKTNPYGFSDSLPSTGNAFLASGEQRSIRIDLLPRIVRALRSGEKGLDGDLSHWTITAAYHGSHIWGDVSIVTQWSDWNLTASIH